MAKTRILLDWLPLDRGCSVPLYRQLSKSLRNAISQEDIAIGSTMPSSRVLAAELNVSRNTVLRAYEELIAEGVLEALEGSATSVRDAPGLRPDPALSSATAEVDLDEALSSRVQGWNRFASVPLDLPPETVAFAPGNPSFERFPVAVWSRLLATEARRMHPSVAGEDAHSAGYGPLREEIAAYLRTSRVVDCSPDQVFVVTSSRAGTHLICKTIGDQGDACLFEDPGWNAARYVVRAAGLGIVPAPVDAEGLRIDEVQAQRLRAAYVTPSHQFPTGVSLSARRRAALLGWAERQSAFIIEDDYDSEFHFDSKPLPSLQGLDGGRRVFYVGTFAKVLFPSLRVAYVVVPKALVVPFSKLLLYLGHEPPLHVQAALARFMAEGHFHAHIRRMRRVYRLRQRVLVDALRQHLDGHLDVARPAGGLQMYLPLPETVRAADVCARAAERGICVVDMRRYALGANPPNALFLGYAGVPDLQIGPAAKKLAQAILDVA